jgi:hypothetical protein
MASVIVDVKVVVIPKREIEAWLLYDGDAIATAFRERTRPRLPGDPEALDNPKRHLRNVVWATYHKDYLNTIHNPQIARKVDLGRLSRSASFSPYRPFCAAIKGNLDREAALRRPGTARKRAGRRHR